MRFLFESLSEAAFSIYYAIEILLMIGLFIKSKLLAKKQHPWYTRKACTNDFKIS
jgi:hypothetical protein